MHMSRKVIVYGLIASMLAFAILVVIVAAKEVPYRNSYAELAAGWLDGRLHAERCFDTDCALYDGREYIIFPPFPGVVALPFVAMFGVGFRWFISLGAMFGVISALAWYAILEKQIGQSGKAFAVVVAIVAGSPLAQVIATSDGVWYFAQNISFCLCSLAIYFATVRRNAFLVGVCVGLSLLSRQMTVLILPALYFLSIESNIRHGLFDGARVNSLINMAIGPTIGVAIYGAYNYVRFGSLTNTGYSYIFPRDMPIIHPESVWLYDRVRDLGIFSEAYLPYNLIYAFINGPHITFGGKYMTEISGVDVSGASVLIMSPILLFMVLAKWNKMTAVMWACIIPALVITLFYHSNGYAQLGAQRYMLDWLPLGFLLVARAVRYVQFRAVGVIVGYGAAMTLSFLVLARLYWS